jgi:tRNA A-37 threonylcarbamoyl transferase component Bud32
VLPRFDETLRPEFWRFTGKIRFFVVVLLSLQTAVVSTQRDSLHVDIDVFWRVIAVLTPVHLLDMAAGLWIWRGRLGATGMRRLTIACCAMECATTVFTAQAHGTVNSHMVVFMVVIVLIYRLAFDFRIALLALGMLVVGLWGAVIAETQGWLRPQPITLDPVDYVYREAAREVNAMMILTILAVLTFVLANWAVARMRFKEVTIRLLREQLSAADAGRVGRHSGRTLVETYTIGGLVGTGGMGEVYEGEHRRTRRRVAVKLLHPHLVGDANILARFRREAEAIGRLGSEHIVEIVDVGKDEEQPFLVLEYLDGESLGARIAAGPLELAMIEQIVRQLAMGLDAAHRAGVVHRDLKPENVYLCRRDDGSLLVKILDFGVSKIHDHATALTQEVALLGTPDYMSPEQAVGLVEEVGERSDVFSLGAIVYAAVTGRAPFAASSVPAQLRRICDEEPVPIADLRPDVPAGVAAVIAIAMAKRTDQRYASAGDLAADLSAAIAGTVDPAVTARAARIERGRPASRTEPGVAHAVTQAS